MQARRGVRTSLAMGAYRNLICAAEGIVKFMEIQLAPVELTVTQYRAMEALFLGGPMSQARLCQFTYTASSSTSLALRILERGNFVTRRVDETHRKRHVITITARGKVAMARLMPYQTRLIRSLMAVLDRREQAVLTRLCQKLIDGDEAKCLRELLKTMAESRTDWVTSVRRAKAMRKARTRARMQGIAGG